MDLNSIGCFGCFVFLAFGVSALVATFWHDWRERNPKLRQYIPIDEAMDLAEDRDNHLEDDPPEGYAAGEGKHRSVAERSVEMSVPTPQQYVADFLSGKSYTSMQLQRLWNESYAGRLISWKGKLEDCKDYGETVHAYVAVDEGNRSLTVSVDLPHSFRDSLLTMSVGHTVIVRGRLQTGPPGGFVALAEDTISVNEIVSAEI